MPVFVSLLRAVNVAGHKPVKSAVLKAAHEALGFERVTTLLASGNVVFAAKAKPSPAGIADAIEKQAGLRTTVIVRSAKELKAVADKNPFPKMAEDDPGHLVWMALAGKPDRDAARRLAEAYSGVEDVAIAGADAYVTYPNGIGRSKLTNALLEKHLGVAGTGRNWNTVAKLLAAAEALDRDEASGPAAAG